jgi:WD40 repeat protein
MTERMRAGVLAVAAIVLVAVGYGYTMHAAGRDGRDTTRTATASGGMTLSAPGRMVFRDTRLGPDKDHLVSVSAADPAGPRVTSGVTCLRFHAAAGTGSCLRDRGTTVPSYEVAILDDRLTVRRLIPLGGIPTRTRVSPSGRMAAWTVFVSGDSYAGTNFSTRTSLLDTRTGAYVPSLEVFTVIRDGRPFRAVDMNFWGVTFADDNRFYATLGLTRTGRTYLVEGDVAARRVRTLRENAECPSLSPDGTRLIFKKRVRPAESGRPWRLYVLDLRTMRETPLAEERSVDDQAVWVDSRTVMYALSGDFGADLWTVPADGSGTPAKRLAAALAPAFGG